MRSRCAHRCSTSAGPCDAVIDFNLKSKTVKRQMLLLLPALRLLRALFRCRLGLRLSLLRHCCPPSHLVMAMSEQCPRESQALHSDYYSAAKKSATPLNEACMRARRHKLLCSQRHRRTRCSANRCQAQQMHCCSAPERKNTDSIDVFARSAFSC